MPDNLMGLDEEESRRSGWSSRETGGAAGGARGSRGAAPAVATAFMDPGSKGMPPTVGDQVGLKIY